MVSLVLTILIALNLHWCLQLFVVTAIVAGGQCHPGDECGGGHSSVLLPAERRIPSFPQMDVVSSHLQLWAVTPAQTHQLALSVKN